MLCLGIVMLSLFSSAFGYAEQLSMGRRYVWGHRAMRRLRLLTAPSLVASTLTWQIFYWTVPQLCAGS